LQAETDASVLDNLGQAGNGFLKTKNKAKN
jgi:hypothetical protein